jgi:uncharacterized protein (TIGR02996 family)
MSEEDVFLRIILAEPDDDLHRFVYADCLLDRDDPRGEFIHAQCRLARMGHDDPLRASLEARERFGESRSIFRGSRCQSR